jgi:hypothetical protein
MMSPVCEWNGAQEFHFPDLSQPERFFGCMTEFFVDDERS